MTIPPPFGVIVTSDMNLWLSKSLLGTKLTSHIHFWLFNGAVTVRKEGCRSMTGQTLDAATAYHRYIQPSSVAPNDPYPNYSPLLFGRLIWKYLDLLDSLLDFMGGS